MNKIFLNLKVYKHYPGTSKVKKTKELISTILHPSLSQQKKLREKFVIDRGEISEQQRKRKSPYDEPQEVPAILQLSKLRHRQPAVKWACGRFPPLSTSLLEEKFGEKIPANLNTLKTLLSRIPFKRKRRVQRKKRLWTNCSS